jgi:hypothetical protein
MQLGVQIVVDNPEELEAIRRRFADTLKLANETTDHFYSVVNLK